MDSSDRARLEICREELFSLLDQEKLAGASLLIFANKQDVQGSLTKEEIAQVLQLNTSNKFSSRHWSIIPCSAVTGDGLISGMDWMTDDIASRIFMLS